MIEAEDFVEAARQRGFTRYSGVPCSFLTPFINYVINDARLGYVSSANEGDALATAAGAAVGGEGAVVMMQNSGLGNAVSPITSLAWVFQIPLLIITTHRGAPGVKDEPQHELMGSITGNLLDLMQVPWQDFPALAAGIEPALGEAAEHLRRQQRPYGFIMQKGTVRDHALRSNPVPDLSGRQCRRREFTGGDLASRSQVLEQIIRLTPVAGTVLIATTGYTGRELYACADRPNHFYMVGSMGCASSFGLGLALARPDLRVIVLDGDGAALMRMGNFATLGSYGGANLVHLLLDNEVHDSTGAQATVTRNVRFADIAAACGYAASYSGTDPELIPALLDLPDPGGPRFGHLKIRSGTLKDLPRPEISPPAVVRRLMRHIGAGFRE